MTNLTAPVSVIIPCYLCVDTIERAVLSVLTQTMLPGEILLIDDASPDNGTTLQTLKQLAQKYRNILSIQVIESTRNGGPGNARNRGWELASQPYLAFLDADDIWLPQKIECQYTWMRNHPNYVLTSHQQIILKDKKNLIQEGITSSDINHIDILADKLLYFNLIATRTVMLKREQAYKFLEGKRYSEDYFLWLMIILNDGRAAKLEKVLAATFKPDFGVGGLSSRLIKMEIGELECYFKLYNAKLINFSTLIFTTSFSVIKFIRRMFLTIFLKIFR